MAKLTTKARKALSASSFVFPASRKFPIEDASHARNALSRAAAKGGRVEATVKRKVHQKYPKIGEQHGPVDDMQPSMGVKVTAHVRKAPKGYSGEMKHQAQMGTLRALGGKMC